MYGAEVPSFRNLFKFGVTLRLKYSGRNPSYEIIIRPCSRFDRAWIVPHIANGNSNGNMKK